MGWGVGEGIDCWCWFDAEDHLEYVVSDYVLVKILVNTFKM